MEKPGIRFEQLITKSCHVFCFLIVFCTVSDNKKAHVRRNVQQDGSTHWQDQAHFHEWLQDGTKGDVKA